MVEAASLDVLDRLLTLLLDKLNPASVVSLHYAIQDLIQEEFVDLEELMEKWEANIKIENESSMDEIMIRYILDEYTNTFEVDSEDITSILDRIHTTIGEAASHIEIPN